MTTRLVEVASSELLTAVETLAAEMLVSWSVSIEKKKEHDVNTLNRSYWQGFADAKALLIGKLREIIAVEKTRQEGRPTPQKREAKIEAWAAEWAKCWNSVALRLLQDVLRQHESLGHQAVALMRTASQWQPIETAPRDGAPILAWWRGGAIVVRWTNSGWRVAVLSSAVYIETPTHWMPLPEGLAQEPKPQDDGA